MHLAIQRGGWTGQTHIHTHRACGIEKLMLRLQNKSNDFIEQQLKIWVCTSKTGHFSHKTLDLTPRWAYFWSQGSIEVAAPTTCATAMGQWCSCVQCKRQLCWWPRIAQYAPTYWEWTVSIWAPSSHHPMSMSSMGFSHLHSWNQQPNSHLAEGSVFNLILYAYGCVCL